MTSLFWWRLRHDRNYFAERAQMWIAWHLPGWLVYRCAVRLMAHATTGEYGNQEPGNISIIDALKRWGK